jgi:hypothetical protein
MGKSFEVTAKDKEKEMSDNAPILNKPINKLL